MGQRFNKRVVEMNERLDLYKSSIRTLRMTKTYISGYVNIICSVVCCDTICVCVGISSMESVRDITLGSHVDSKHINATIFRMEFCHSHRD